MNYIQCQFTFKEPKPWAEILIATIGDLPFESFEEKENIVYAYIPENKYKETDLTAILAQFPYQEIVFKKINIKSKNWNAEWEKNYPPIFVENKCVIKTPFHVLKQTYPYEILIVPQMSFGTGHHQTTYLMLKAMLVLNFKNKIVLDMGCGTGVLAILAAKLKAKEILAIDIDEWAYQNTRDNISKNKCTTIKAKQGGAELLQKNLKFDLILANINRNILVADMDTYITVLNKNGKLLMSGFYTSDIPLIEAKANKLGLIKSITLEKEGWAMVEFTLL